MGQRIEARLQQLLGRKNDLAEEVEKIEKDLQFVESLKKADAIVEKFLENLRKSSHPLTTRFIIIFEQIERCIDQLIDNPQGFYNFRDGIDEMGGYLNRFNGYYEEAKQPLNFLEKLLQRTVSEKLDKVIETHLNNDALAALGAFWAQTTLKFDQNNDQSSS